MSHTYPTAYDELEALFDAARVLPADGQLSFVETHCLGRPILRERLVGLLQRQGSDFHTTLRAALEDAYRRAPADEQRLHIGAVVDGRYEVRELLGRGGQGCVYRVHDLTDGQTLALKTSIAFDRTADLVREAEILGHLDHPHIARVHRCAEWLGHCVYYVMDFYPCGSLQSLIREQPSTKVILLALVQVADALIAAQEQGIFHCDVKPSNVLVERVDHDTIHTRLSDFGLAFRSTSPGEWRMSGTPGYMAPEVILGEVPNDRSDVYSLAVMAMQLLAGEIPPYTPPVELMLRRLREPRG